MLDNVKLCDYKILTPIQIYGLFSILKNINIIDIAQKSIKYFKLKTINIDSRFRIWENDRIFDFYVFKIYKKGQKTGNSSFKFY